MKCALEKLIDHKDIPDKYTKQFMFCSLFEKKSHGMTETDTVEASCCIRCSMVFEAIADLRLRSTINIDDLRGDNWFYNLPTKLQPYAVAIRKESGKDWIKLIADHASCKRDVINANDGIVATESENIDDFLRGTKQSTG
jgi:hypothetical protein